MAGRLDESALIASLRAGDESIFAGLVDSYTPALLHVARNYVPSREIAEDVAAVRQELEDYLRET